MDANVYDTPPLPPTQYPELTSCFFLIYCDLQFVRRAAFGGGIRHVNTNQTSAPCRGGGFVYVERLDEITYRLYTLYGW